MAVEITLFDRELNVIERRAVEGETFPHEVRGAVMPPMHKLLKEVEASPDVTVPYRTIVFRHVGFGAYLEAK